MHNVEFFRFPSRTIPGGEPEYLEQPARTDVSKQLKEDSVRAITKAFTEQEDKSYEAIMQLVRKEPNVLSVVFFMNARVGFLSKMCVL